MSAAAYIESLSKGVATPKDQALASNEIKQLVRSLQHCERQAEGPKRISYGFQGPPRDFSPESTSRYVEGEALKPEVYESHDYVERVADTSDYHGELIWHGWALREAFLAGVTYQSRLNTGKDMES